MIAPSIRATDGLCVRTADGGALAVPGLAEALAELAMALEAVATTHSLEAMAVANRSERTHQANEADRLGALADLEHAAGRTVDLARSLGVLEVVQ